MENKQEKFIRVAEKRTSELINKIRVLSKCSDNHSYGYTAVQIDEIFNAIEKELQQCRIMFDSGESARTALFFFSSKAKLPSDDSGARAFDEEEASNNESSTT